MGMRAVIQIQRQIYYLFVIIMLFGLSGWGAKGDTILCPRFGFKSSGQVSLNDSELKLVCGDPKNPDWKEIPDNQAIFHLKAFLQLRGYYHPTFESQGKQILIVLGERTYVTQLTIKNEPSNFDSKRLRRIVGEVMTPDLLDEVSKRIQQRLQSIGYACPKVQIAGNDVTGELIVTLDSPVPMNLVNVIEEPIKDLDEKIFSRYHAFVVGNIFNQDYLSLTAHRILDQALVQSTYFVTQCDSRGATATQKFVAGPSRLIKIDLGVDTERLFIFRTSWKNARMGKTASNLEFVAKASLRDQQFSAQSAWYLLPYPSRFYLQPSLFFEHENINPYENILGKIQLAPTITADSQDLGFSFFLGPTLTLSRTFRGIGPTASTYASLSSGVRVSQHYHEWYKSSPRTGFSAEILADVANESIISDFSAEKIQLSFEKLWNFRNYDPPFLVIGLRGFLGTTFRNENVTGTKLPIEYRYFLGGSPDLRGFSYREIPGDGEGAGSSISASLELRFTDLLPWNIQPFLFGDAGQVGKEALSLQGPLFWSPGFGIRWESPVGVIRTTLAHGYPEPSHWQFYFSFGEEF
jgi:translocation and assembly module TamA